MKRIIFRGFIAVIVVVLAVVSIIANHKCTVLRNELMIAKEDKKELEQEVLETNSKLDRALRENNQLTAEFEEYEEKLIGMAWSSYEWNNLFMGAWRIGNVEWKGRPVTDETATEMLEKHIGYPLIIEEEGVTYLGVRYDLFKYRVFFQKNMECIIWERHPLKSMVRNQNTTTMRSCTCIKMVKKYTLVASLWKMRILHV